MLTKLLSVLSVAAAVLVAPTAVQAQHLACSTIVLNPGMLGVNALNQFALTSVPITGAMATTPRIDTIKKINSVIFDAVALHRGWNATSFPEGVMPRPTYPITDRLIEAVALKARYYYYVKQAPHYKYCLDIQMAQALTGTEFDWTSTSTDINDPMGWANVYAKKWWAVHVNDGMNMDGSDPKGFVGQRYSDTTDYLDKVASTGNTAYELVDPNSWAPNPVHYSYLRQDSSVQNHVTPQAGFANTVVPGIVDRLWSQVPAPPNRLHYSGKYDIRKVDKYKADPRNAGYFAQMEDVLATMGNATATEQAIAECWDNKSHCPAMFHTFLMNTYAPGGDTWLNRVISQGWYNMGSIDAAGHLAWRTKYEYNYIRPYSAIREFYRDQLVPSFSYVSARIEPTPGQFWQPYIGTMNHNDYLSGTSCICSAVIEAAREYIYRVTGERTNTLKTPFTVNYLRLTHRPYPETSSDIRFTYTDLNKMEEDCHKSRVVAGVHFKPATVNGKEVCRQIGREHVDYIYRAMDGKLTTNDFNKNWVNALNA